MSEDAKPVFPKELHLMTPEELVAMLDEIREERRRYTIDAKRRSKSADPMLTSLKSIGLTPAQITELYQKLLAEKEAKSGAHPEQTPEPD